jgi:hypothetical protein
VEDGTGITLKRVEISSWKTGAICDVQKSFFQETIQKTLVKCSNTNSVKDFWNYLFTFKDKCERFLKRIDLLIRDNFYVSDEKYPDVNCYICMLLFLIRGPLRRNQRLCGVGDSVYLSTNHSILKNRQEDTIQL